MPRFKVRISDTMTFSRECGVVVTATNEAAARKIAWSMTRQLVYPKEMVVDDNLVYRPGMTLDMDEQEINNTPWEIDIEPVRGEPIVEHQTNAEGVARIIAIARETYEDVGDDRGIDVPADAEVNQEIGGCWVQARVWMANVYIHEGGEG